MNYFKYIYYWFYFRLYILLYGLVSKIKKITGITK